MTNTIDCSTITKEKLSDDILINEMVSTSGCTHEQAKQFLILTEWKLQVLISKMKIDSFI